MVDVISDLSGFGYRELMKAVETLKAYAEGHYALNTEPETLNQHVSLVFNPSSGYVFLTDEDYNVLMLNNDDKLEEFVSCPNCGNEAFKTNLDIDENGKCYQCK